MEAGGLNVVLIHYIGITPGHMNVGVYLPSTPVYHTAGLAPTDFVYDNKTYWTAEATSAENWKVGDQSNSLSSATPILIPVNSTNIDETSPGQVLANLGKQLLSSQITVNLTEESSNTNATQQESLLDEPRSLNISGFITPPLPSESVSIYISNSTAYHYFTAVTDNDGRYMLTWNFTSPGTYHVRASWSSALKYAGADSQSLEIFVGPQSFIQFETPEYNYIYLDYLQATLASYEIRPLEGINNFLSIPLGSAISVSYNFSLLQAGQTVTNVPTKNVTIQKQAIGSNGRPTGQTQDQTITVPVNVPSDLVPMLLPDEFNKTLNDQFCFILKNNNGNFSLSAQGLNDVDVATMKLGASSNLGYMNVSQNIRQNVWYHVTEDISQKTVTASLYSSNGSLLASSQTPNNATASNEMVMWITNNQDSAVILKDLTVKAISNPVQTPPETNEKTSLNGEYLIPIILLIIGSAIIAASVAAVYLKKGKTKKRPTLQDEKA